MAIAPSLIIPAFPQSVAAEVASVAAWIPEGIHPLSNDTIGQVHFRNSELRIPARIYSREPAPNAISHATGVQNRLIACWYTRHHNGFVREKYLRQLFPTIEAWCLPFVIQLVGEYVPEIIDYINTNADAIPKDNCQDFARENEPFLKLIRDRVISYWLLWRSRYPVFDQYPGYQVLSKLGLWGGDQGKRLLR